MSNMVSMRQAKQEKQESAFKRNQRIAEQMPGVLMGLHKQMKQVVEVVGESSEWSIKQADILKDQRVSLDRLHDRLDSLVVESRVTNVLLAELVALQQAVITEPVDDLREAVRNEAYARIVNGG